MQWPGPSAWVNETLICATLCQRTLATLGTKIRLKCDSYLGRNLGAKLVGCQVESRQSQEGNVTVSPPILKLDEWTFSSLSPLMLVSTQWDQDNLTWSNTFFPGKVANVKLNFGGSSPGLVVMGVGSHSEGREFKSQHWMEFFTEFLPQTLPNRVYSLLFSCIPSFTDCTNWWLLVLIQTSNFSC